MIRLNPPIFNSPHCMKTLSCKIRGGGVGGVFSCGSGVVQKAGFCFLIALSGIYLRNIVTIYALLVEYITQLTCYDHYIH